MLSCKGESGGQRQKKRDLKQGLWSLVGCSEEEDSIVEKDLWQGMAIGFFKQRSSVIQSKGTESCQSRSESRRTPARYSFHLGETLSRRPS